VRSTEKEGVMEGDNKHARREKDEGELRDKAKMTRLEGRGGK
jgi:hypothetical protein